MSDPHLPQLPELPESISFSSELIKARNDLGLTQSQLSTKCCLSLSALKAYERGRNMPGARELRELSQALQVSPNKLLFGEEHPFKVRSVMTALADGESENEMVSNMRAGVLLCLLSSDERDAVITLSRSLAIARHGADVVRNTFLQADVVFGISQAALKAHEVSKTTNDIDSEKMASDVDNFLSRQGHNSDPKRLLKK